MICHPYSEEFRYKSLAYLQILLVLFCTLLITEYLSNMKFVVSTIGYLSDTTRIIYITFIYIKSHMYIYLNTIRSFLLVFWLSPTPMMKDLPLLLRIIMRWTQMASNTTGRLLTALKSIPKDSWRMSIHRSYMENGNTLHPKARSSRSLTLPMRTVTSQQFLTSKKILKI